MKDGQYYSIQGWMGKRLGLRANDLICFAIIYGFSMDGESQFKGNLIYLSKCMFATEPTALLCLKHLLDCNLILKQEDVKNGKKRCYYSTNIIYNEGDFEVVDTTKEPLVMTTKESLVMTTKESLPKEYNNKDNKEENKEKKYNKKSSRFVKPTVELVEAYCKEKKYDLDAQYFIDYYDARGWMLGKNHIKDWKACIRTWMRKSKENNNNECSASDEQQPSEPSQAEQLYDRFLAWADKNIPAIKDAVTLEIFKEMRVDVNFNGSVFAAILKKIELTGDIDRILHEDGYLWSEFTRIRTEIYNDL